MGRGRSKLGGDGTFREMTGEEEAKFYSSQKITEGLQRAFDKYTNPNREPGSLYNFSQEMNRAVAEDRPLTREQQEVFDEIEGSMRSLGRNVTLTRYDHPDTINEILRKVGAFGDAASMTADQLSDALVGVKYTDKRILSTSVNGFKNSSDPATFTTRQFKITYRAKPGTKAVMPGVGRVPMRGSGMSSGDDFGELLLGTKNKYSIKEVKYSGKKARAKGRPKHDLSRDQIEIIVEVG